MQQQPHFTQKSFIMGYNFIGFYFNMFEQIGDIYNSINILSYKRFIEDKFAPLAAAAPLYAKEFYNGI